MRTPTNISTRESTRAAGSLLAVLIGLVCLPALSGCAGRNDSRFPGANSATSNPATGDWVCEAGKAADDWDCIQSENIEPILSELEVRKAQEAQKAQKEAQREAQKQAQELEKARALGQPLPVTGPLDPNFPASPLEPVSTALENIEAPESPVPLPPAQPEFPQTEPPQTELPQLQRREPQPSQAEPPPPPGDGQASANGSSTTGSSATKDQPLTTAKRPADRIAGGQEPSYAQFAYRPKEPVRIIDLPEDFYAAQLLAVSTKAQIEDFVITNDLYNMSAARIERDGRILYVLLLGVYESKEIALKAVQNMPSDVRDLEPWVRPIDGLQKSMTRADRLMATASSN